MKFVNYILITLLVFSIYTSKAETPKFFLENMEVGKIKALEVGKPIYLNLYAEWAPVCHYMKEQVFSKEEVNHFFSSRFVCVEVDVNSVDGQQLMREYNVSDFPTHLFLNSNGQILHRVIGLLDPEKMIETGQKALMPHLRLSGLKNKFNTNPSNVAITETLLNTLRSAGLSTDSVLDVFWASLSNNQKTKNAHILLTHLNTVEQKSFNDFFENRAQYYTSLGRDKVNQKLIELWENQLMEKLYGDNSKEYHNAKSRLQKSDFEFAIELLAKSKTEEMLKDERWDDFVAAAEHYIQEFSINDPAFLNSSAWIAYENVNKPELLEKALLWSEKALSLEDSYFYYETYAALLFKTGQFKTAHQIIKKALKIAEETQADPSLLFQLNNRMLASQ